jgi:hypothetical protein
MQSVNKIIFVGKVAVGSGSAPNVEGHDRRDIPARNGTQFHVERRAQEGD